MGFCEEKVFLVVFKLETTDRAVKIDPRKGYLKAYRSSVWDGNGHGDV